MKKIIDFCKEKYKLLIPLMVGLVLLITLLFLYKEYIYDNTKNKQEVKVYQQHGTGRNEFTAILTYNLKDVIVDLKAKDIKMKFGSEPVYYQDEEKAIFPKEMTVVFPAQTCSQYKTYKHATFYKEDNAYYVKNNDNLDYYNNFFFFDGENLFFFPYEVNLMINDKKYKELGEMSYVRVVAGTTLIYYDTTTESSEFIELKTGDRVSVYNEELYLDVEISIPTCTAFGRKILLFKPDNLNPLSKTIDK